ncbi:MAG: fructose-6-phosphate aldolase [Bacteroidetes bacterium]|nr:fructose-6-phosphate aldolase [Bacteroidota bacterium]MCY4224391.1 fructose-6-phosphate aldolase [Bacteroidota bacterium]
MKFFIDTADLSEIQEAKDMGLLDGVTTNPSLMKVAAERAGQPLDFADHIGKICDLVPGDVSAEVTAVTFDGMMIQGRELAAIRNNVVVKIPLILDGIKAIKALAQEGIRSNCTLCFSPTQALLAAKAGAAYISPFIGRLDDASSDGMKLVQEIIEIYSVYGYDTEVLAASIRHPMHVLESALMGAHVATMPLSVIKKLLYHPLTDIGLTQFMDDWSKFQEQS